MLSCTFSFLPPPFGFFVLPLDAFPSNCIYPVQCVLALDVQYASYSPRLGNPLSTLILLRLILRGQTHPPTLSPSLIRKRYKNRVVPFRFTIRGQPEDGRFEIWIAININTRDVFNKRTVPRP